MRLSLEFLDLERDAARATTRRRARRRRGTAPSRAAGTAAMLVRGMSWRRACGSPMRSGTPGDATSSPTRRRIPEAARPRPRRVARRSCSQLTDTSGAARRCGRERSLRRRSRCFGSPSTTRRRPPRRSAARSTTASSPARRGGAAPTTASSASPIDDLRASMAISTRTRAIAGANAFTLARLLVPAGEIEHRRALRGASPEATDAGPRRVGHRPAWTRSPASPPCCPRRCSCGSARQQAETSTSPPRTCAAAPFDLLIAGARIEANYPIGPLGGTAFNLTMLSYGGSLDMGLNIDPAAVADPELLRRPDGRVLRGAW